MVECAVAYIIIPPPLLSESISVKQIQGLSNTEPKNFSQKYFRLFRFDAYV